MSVVNNNRFKSLSVTCVIINLMPLMLMMMLLMMISLSHAVDTDSLTNTIHHHDDDTFNIINLLLPSQTAYRTPSAIVFLNRADSLIRFERVGRRPGRLSIESWLKVIQQHQSHVDEAWIKLDPQEKDELRSVYEQAMHHQPPNESYELSPSTTNTTHFSTDSDSDSVRESNSTSASFLTVITPMINNTSSSSVVIDSNMNEASRVMNWMKSLSSESSSAESSSLSSLSDSMSSTTTSMFESIPPMSSNKLLALEQYDTAATRYFRLFLPTILNPRYEVPVSERDDLRRLIRQSLGQWKAARRFASKVGVSRTIQTFHDRIALWRALTSIPINTLVDVDGQQRRATITAVQRDAKRLYQSMTQQEQQWMKQKYDMIMKTYTD